MNFKTNTVISSLIALVFIFLFTYTALSKALEFEHFKNTLQYSPLIGKWNVIMASCIIIIEGFTSLFLLIPALKLLGLYIAALLMLIFTGYISYMLLSNSQLPCSCGGIIKELSWSHHLVLNIILTALAFTALFFEHRHKKLNSQLLKL